MSGDTIYYCTVCSELQARPAAAVAVKKISVSFDWCGYDSISGGKFQTLNICQSAISANLQCPKHRNIEWSTKVGSPVILVIIAVSHTSIVVQGVGTRLM